VCVCVCERERETACVLVHVSERGWGLFFLFVVATEGQEVPGSYETGVLCVLTQSEVAFCS